MMIRLKTIILFSLFISVSTICIVAFSDIAELSDAQLSDEENKITILKPQVRVKRENEETPETTSTSNITFNLCCGLDQYFNDQLECVNWSASFKDELPEKIRMIAGTLAVDDNFANSSIDLSRIHVDYNFGKNNGKPLKRLSGPAIVVTFSDEPLNYYISEKNGSLLEMGENNTVISVSDTSSYCLAEFENSSLVVLRFPCLEKFCIQKCCPSYSYYNIDTNSCKRKPPDDNTEINLSFYNDTIRINRTIPFHLTNANVNCTNIELTKDEKDRQIYLQENGNLLMVLKTGKLSLLLNSKEYCVDLLSDGSSDSNYKEGFFSCSSTSALTNSVEVIKTPKPPPEPQQPNIKRIEDPDSVLRAGVSKLEDHLMVFIIIVFFTAF